MTAIPATVLWWCIKFRGYTTSPGRRPANTDSVRHTPPVRFAAGRWDVEGRVEV